MFGKQERFAMKGDFSRVRFSAEKNYTAVLQQQGRVALDADANEQCAIDNYLRDTETRDIVGRWGGPAGEEGFAITLQGDSLEIGRGRYYVNGILCENPRPLAYAQQPFLIDPSPTFAALLSNLAQGSIQVIQVYLEVWQRLVTALDDPCLREPALGQADTTARLQTVWRVIAETPQPAAFQPARPAPPSDLISLAGEISSAPLALETDSTPSDLLAADRAVLTPVRIVGDCCAAMRRTPKTVENRGKLSAFTAGGGGDCSCQPTPAAGYLGLENQLYRVEIQRGGDQTQATFIWSRENASVVSAITGVSGSQVYVDSLGLDANLGFTPGQWVEISDDSYLFGSSPNQPGDLYQIASVTPETLSVTLTQTVASVDPAKNARLRRWDQFGTSAGSSGISLPVAAAYTLESGISVQFTAGQYEPGDYWLIPARTATGEIDWPPCDSDGSTFQPPQQIEVFRAPLACLQWDRHKRQAVVSDCREKFYPLTELTPKAAPPALHVTNISWSNDDVMTLDQLVANGLTVTLDQNAPESQYVTPANFIVTLEVALPVSLGTNTTAPVLSPGSAPTNSTPSTGTDFGVRYQSFLDSIGVSRLLAFTALKGRIVALVRFELVVDGDTSASGSNLLWQAPWERDNAEETVTLELLDVLLLVGARRGDFGRVRVKLAGRSLFAGGLNRVFLDGQSLGAPALRADGATPRIDLQLPSGSGAAASDFESWFYVAPTQAVASLSIDHPSLRVNQGGTVVDASNATAGAVSPQGTVTLVYPAIADTVVGLSFTGPNAAGIFSIPQNVVVLKGHETQTFPIALQGNPGSAPENWQIVATLDNALGVSSSQQATLTITGY
jgi:Family of unknown function (DUF6519)